MKSKLKFIVPLVVLLALGGVYKFVLSEPEAEAKPKIEGQVYVLPKEFLVNLAGERFAKMNVALVLEGHEQTAVETEEGGATPPEGFGPLPQEAAVRDIITDELTGADADDLIDRPGRASLKKRIVKAIEHDTDVKVDEVLFTDVAVQ